MIESEKPAAEAAIDKALGILGEHFECVQILASTCEGDMTNMNFSGRGNFYARLGMARDFLIEDGHKNLATKINEKKE